MHLNQAIEGRDVAAVSVGTGASPKIGRKYEIEAWLG
jgi:hypothetical protein